MGVRALPLYRVKLDGVRVPAELKLGGEQGIDYGRLISRSQVALAALAVGVADAAAEYARNYAKQRVQFGVPIAQKQAIAFMLAEMAIEVDAARLLVWEAAATARRGRRRDQSSLSRQAVRRQSGHVRHRQRRADARRLRLHPRIPGGALAAQRARLHNLSRSGA